MCVVSALGATLRASGQRSPRASGAPHALPDSSCAADRSGDRTLRFSFGKFITCADVKTLRAVNGTCFISNQGSLAFSDFTMESLSSSSSSPSLSLHLTGHPGQRSCGCSKLTSRFCPWPRRPFFCSLSPTSPVSLILYKFVGFVLKSTRVFPDRPPPVPPPHPLHSRTPPCSQNTCCTSLLSEPVALCRYCGLYAPHSTVS